ncbi:hypothetical protein [Negadavirga shengliensis]|uniref:Uncharacterized protein n=1 Tax=Negadavirga shengliensis TaxID=1389218 RepID=A0ABV9T377_9BACT
MSLRKKTFENSLKYGVPIVIIAATIAMKRSKGLGSIAVFAVTAPILVGFLLGLKKLNDDHQQP